VTELATENLEQVDDGVDEKVEPVDQVELRPALEAILLVADEPVPVMTLAQVLNAPVPNVEDALRALADDYTAGGRGFDLREVAGAGATTRARTATR